MQRLVTRPRLTLAGLALAGAAAAGIMTARTDSARATIERMPELAHLRAQIPAYPDAPFYPLGNSLWVDGRAREMGHATTKDSPRKVIDRYEGIYTSRGHHVERGAADGEEWLIATDVIDPVIRTVVATRGDDGVTSIIASASSKLDVHESTAETPPRCTQIHSTGGRDGHLVTDILFLRCPMALAEVCRFYDAALGDARRRSIIAPTVDHKQAEVEYVSQRRVVSLLLSQVSSVPLLTTVAITWQEER